MHLNHIQYTVLGSEDHMNINCVWKDKHFFKHYKQKETKITKSLQILLESNEMPQVSRNISLNHNQ